MESCCADEQVNVLTHAAQVKRPPGQSKTINKLQKKYEAEDMCELYGRKNEASGGHGRKPKRRRLDISIGPKSPGKEESIVGDSTVLESQGKEEEDTNVQWRRSMDLGHSRAYAASCALKCSASPKSKVS